MIETLSSHDVLSIHEVLTADFAAAADPISPSGVKSMELLESAVGRQHAGFHDRLKYDTPVSNAAALTYGICLNHPFHNGNKRTREGAAFETLETPSPAPACPVRHWSVAHQRRLPDAGRHTVLHGRAR